MIFHSSLLRPGLSRSGFASDEGQTQGPMFYLAFPKAALSREKLASGADKYDIASISPRWSRADFEDETKFRATRAFAQLVPETHTTKVQEEVRQQQAKIEADEAALQLLVDRQTSSRKNRGPRAQRKGQGKQEAIVSKQLELVSTTNKLFRAQFEEKTRQIEERNKIIEDLLKEYQRDRKPLDDLCRGNMFSLYFERNGLLEAASAAGFDFRTVGDLLGTAWKLRDESGQRLRAWLHEFTAALGLDPAVLQQCDHFCRVMRNGVETKE